MSYGMREVGLAVAAVAALVSGASAHDGRFYVRILANAGSLGTASEKIVIVREGAPMANPPAVGDTRVSLSSSLARGATIGPGLFAGYRRQFADDGRYFSAEAQVRAAARRGASCPARACSSAGTGRRTGAPAQGLLDPAADRPGRQRAVALQRAADEGRVRAVGVPVNGLDQYLLDGARDASRLPGRVHRMRSPRVQRAGSFSRPPVEQRGDDGGCRGMRPVLRC